jgi:hypothetical protein
MDISLTFCGKNAQIRLIKKLLDSVPEMLLELTPNGFENSLYHSIHYPTIETAYRHYRLERIRSYYYGQNRDSRRLYEIRISFADFKNIYELPPLNISSEILAIMYLVIGNLLCSDHFVYNNQHRNFAHPAGHFFEKCWLAAVRTSKTFGALRCTVDDIEQMACYNTEVDISPFFRFVFRKIKEWNLEFYYNEDRFFTTQDTFVWTDLKLIQKFSELGEINGEAFKWGKEYKQLVDAELLSEVTKLAPCIIVGAYADEYGVFPDGYL